MRMPSVRFGAAVEVFYDGDCPLCMREIRMLKRRDRHARIQFTNIVARGFDAAAYDTTQAALMTRIRGRLADGSWIEGVEVFRQLYAAIGWRRIVAVSRLPLVSHLLRAGYVLFARNRLRLTGRCAPGGSCALVAPGDPEAAKLRT
jgi:predicted DCC family thiol-disulfide oxidoreductase YuxK